MLISFTLLSLFAFSFPVRGIQSLDWSPGTVLRLSAYARTNLSLAQNPGARRFDTFTTDELAKAYSRRPSPSRTKNPVKGCQDCEIKARLDNFALQLQNDPGAQGYLLSTTSRREGTLSPEQEKAVQAEAGKMLEYLVKARGMDAARFVTVTGYEAKQHEVELWIVPPGAAPPRS